MYIHVFNIFFSPGEWNINMIFVGTCADQINYCHVCVYVPM